MSDFTLLFSHVSFGYLSAAGLLFDDLSCAFPPGWTGVAGFNGGGKTTLLRLAAGELPPESGRIARPGRAFLCAQECEACPPQLAGLIASAGRYPAELRATLGIEPDWAERWPSLSFGERKRAQIGCALFGEYDILCLDEPTNHLDSATSARLREALYSFAGIGLLVSHDRSLLDEFCSQCLFIEPEGAILRSGSYSDGRRMRELERRQCEERFQQEKNEADRMRRELDRRRREADKARRSNSKRHLDRHDHDGKGAVNAGRLTGRDATANHLLKRQRVRLERQQASLAGVRLPAKESFRLDVPLGRRSRRNRLLTLPEMTLPLGAGRTLRVPALELGASDRVALTGRNGAGKSTLLRAGLAQLNLPPEQVFFMPQELESEVREALAARLAALSPQQLGRVMRVIHNLGSSPERVLASARLSPGELRKLYLALGVTEEVELLVLDEPTNHLDLPSVECLEEALAQAAPALLLVSHDARFLARLCSRRWHIEAGELRDGPWSAFPTAR